MSYITSYMLYTALCYQMWKSGVIEVLKNITLQRSISKSFLKCWQHLLRSRMSWALLQIQTNAEPEAKHSHTLVSDSSWGFVPFMRLNWKHPQKDPQKPYEGNRHCIPKVFTPSERIFWLTHSCLSIWTMLGQNQHKLSSASLNY